ncbi:MAG: FKBP-type peptidyl-prolyl cis-trans isomerase [Actinomycetota bacterium]|nr:FKBP-type peptidyl-prolyl cis-trans isomerase [Actinomycetota bacterium]
MRKSFTLTGALVAVAIAVSACGSSGSTAAGVLTAPSQGQTQAAVTSASASATTPTTSSTSTSTTPLPAALKTKPKVVPPSGPAPSKLVVKDLITGTGPAAAATSTVTVNYVGVLDKGGKEFDSSWKRGTTAAFPLSGVIPGWQQGIPGMKVGGRRELIVPASLAYKNQAQPGIPANSALVFVIDLHGVS